MIPKLDIPDGLSRDAAESLQGALAAQVVVEDRLGRIETVAGLDVAYDRQGKRATAAIAVLRADDLSVVETRTLDTAIRFPYIPGLLSFRELPAICALLQQVTVIPDLLICDGQGIAHPRRFGLACHLGVMFDVPAIGCAKTPLLGAVCEPGLARGDSTTLLDRGDIVGCALRTRSGVKPVYVSPGHRISVASACEWVLKLSPRFRLPEPLRLADQAARTAQADRLIPHPKKPSPR
ncbi:MAG: deoxyribonuclease V [Thiobacillus sp.]|nr:deoxyribonuclease V [Thiobacillus sp.]